MGLKKLISLNWRFYGKKKLEKTNSISVLAHVGLMGFINQTSLVNFRLFKLHMLHQALLHYPGQLLDREDWDK